MSTTEKFPYVSGADFNEEREMQDVRGLDYFFPREYSPPSVADAITSAAIPNAAEAIAAAGVVDHVAISKKLPESGLTRAQVEAISLLTLNDNIPESTFAVVNGALCAGKGSFESESSGERDTLLCQCCDFLWILLSGLRKLQVVKKETLYRSVLDTSLPNVKAGDYFYSPGFLYVRTENNSSAALSQGSGVLYVLNGCWGYSVAPFSFYGHQSDVLLEPCSLFEVASVDTSGPFAIVTLNYIHTLMLLDKYLPARVDSDETNTLKKRCLYERRSSSTRGARSHAGVTASESSDDCRRLVVSNPKCEADSERAPQLPNVRKMSRSSSSSAIPSSSSNPVSGDGTPIITESCVSSDATPDHLVSSSSSLTAMSCLSPSNSSSVDACGPSGHLRRSSETSREGKPQTLSQGETRQHNRSPSFTPAAPKADDCFSRLMMDYRQVTSKFNAFVHFNHQANSYFPLGFCEIDLLTALRKAGLADAEEVVIAARHFLDIHHKELLPDFNSLSPQQVMESRQKWELTFSPDFTQDDALHLCVLGLNGFLPNSPLSIACKCLRSKTEAEMKESVEAFWMFLSSLRKLVRFPSDRPLYRAMALPSNISLPFVGKTLFWDDMFYACSNLESSMQLLRDKVTGTSLEPFLFVLKGCRGYSMDLFTFTDTSEYVLLEPGLFFTVTNIEKHEDGVTTVITLLLTSEKLLLEQTLVPYLAGKKLPPLAKADSIDPHNSKAGAKPLAGGAQPSPDSLEAAQMRGLKLSQRLFASKKSDKEYKGQAEADKMFPSFLPNTTAASLQDTGITAFPKALATLSSLQSINFSGNCLNPSLVNLGDPQPKFTRTLVNLDLSFNKLTSLPESMSLLVNLRSLDLSVNALKTIPNCILSLTRLSTLDMSANKIKTIPDGIAQLTALEHLNLNDNLIEVFPPCLCRLTALKHLYLSANKIKRLPELIEQLKSLLILSLADNSIHTFPESMVKLTELQELDLSRNQLEKLPEFVIQLPHLSSLDLTGNKIKAKAFDSRLFQLPNLRALTLTDNPCVPQVKGSRLISGAQVVV